MGRNSPPREIDRNGDANGVPNSTSSTTSSGNSSGLGFGSIRDRLRFKRNTGVGRDRVKRSLLDRPSVRVRQRFNRKGLCTLLPFRGVHLFYFGIFFSVFAFAMVSMVLQSSIPAMMFRQGGEGAGRKSVKEWLHFGSTFRFVPQGILRRLAPRDGLNRSSSTVRVGFRGPRLALILGNMNKDPQALVLFTVAKNLQRLGYVLKIYALEVGEAHPLWRQISGHVSLLGSEQHGHVDWLIFEGIIADSLEAKEVISSLTQEPFGSVPLIWIIQEDTLAKRLPMYEEKGLDHLVSAWKSAFSRADVVVFHDFTLSMLYTVLDTGNFFVIPGSPVDVWAAASYSKNHSKLQIRKDNGFSGDDIVVLVVGSSFIYDELAWDYTLVMHTIGPLLITYGRRNEAGESFKFVFLCGNSTDGCHDKLRGVAVQLGLPQGTVQPYGLDCDVNAVLLMTDIVLYGSSQEEQGFPPLIIRAMTFQIPVIMPDSTIMKKYVVDGTHGIFFPKDNPDALLRAFSLVVQNGRLSKFAHRVASSGKVLAKNILASECMAGYAKLLENVLDFPSDVFLPVPISQIQQGNWEWDLFRNEIEHRTGDRIVNSSIVYTAEDEFLKHPDLSKLSENETDFEQQDTLTTLDWAVLEEIENSGNYERLENDEFKERMEEDPGVWDEIYRNARKAEKLKFEANERDEGELERTGQPVCIYEMYDGAGAWPFLHHGSFYRGLSLSRKERRLRSDDVDAVGRLPLLNSTYYRNILCEMGGMFSVANKMDDVHKRPWIGFQSWRAAGDKASLSPVAERVLEETLLKSKGDVMYFWARLDMGNGISGRSNALTFWSMCDMLNGGNCRTIFEKAFRQMYALPLNIEALPPMPEDGGRWSALNSWVMPTTSFLEFIMFSRMFVDSLDTLHANSSELGTCLLGSSEIERKHCYCRLLDVLVDVWAYHSGRMMVYIEPHSGLLEEQHPLEERKGHMWAKYFNFTLLKSMDEDLAEAADDGDHPRKMWLWPLTGEVHWQGIYDREREVRYRLKMDKKRKTKEKLYERMKYGYKQKSIGRRTI